MIYIQKNQPSAEVTNEINRVKKDGDWKHINTEDPVAVRNVFDLLDKGIIRRQLLSEQKGLCAYCMRRIRDDEATVIEHWIPVSTDGTAALEPANMLACCNGGRTSVEKSKILCCDASKENQSITLNPCNNEQMDRIRYRSDGTIYVYPDDEELTRDINEVLHLNGKVDRNGIMVQDTATRLVHDRRVTYREFEVFIKRLWKLGKPIGPSVRRKLEEISNSTEYVEYAGVWIHFLKRKLRSLSKVS